MVIRVSNIHKAYRNLRILNGVSFEASSGQIIGIIGSNGCGKTTLLSILAGVSKLDSGEIWVDEKISTGREISSFGYVPQINPLPEGLSVKDCLKLWCDDRRVYEDIVSRYGLSEFLDRRIERLSGGMKRRAAIACAMSTLPSVLIMDEPTSALDITYKELIHKDMKDFVAGGGIIIMVTHEAEEIAMCDICMRMNDGVLHEYEKAD